MSENAWIEWSGGACPVQRGTLVDVRHRDGEEFFGHKAGFSTGKNFAASVWGHNRTSGDIIAYRLSGPSA